MPIRAVIKTARLTLRPPSPGDAAQIAAALSDWQVTRWLSAPPFPYGLADAHAFLSGAMAADTKVIDCDGKLAGLIGIKPDLGYWLARGLWGRGLMLEAASAMVAAHFLDPEADALISGHFEGNMRSASVLRRLGFADDMPQRVYARPLGRDVTIQRMQLTRDDWIAANPLRIETHRLILKPFESDRDWQGLARIGGDARVAPMLMSALSPWLEPEVRRWIDTSHWRGHTGFRIGIFDKNNRIIGALGLGGTPPSVMYFLAPACWGQGYATEAMRGFLDWAVPYFALTGLNADHFTDNPASGRVLEKLGFTRSGTGLGRSAARPGPAPIVLWQRAFADDPSFPLGPNILGVRG
ncbi:MAG: GNAT family N-acetyltransferase [Albidovulum sp.]